MFSLDFSANWQLKVKLWTSSSRLFSRCSSRPLFCCSVRRKSKTEVKKERCLALCHWQSRVNLVQSPTFTHVLKVHCCIQVRTGCSRANTLPKTPTVQELQEQGVLLTINHQLVLPSWEMSVSDAAKPFQTQKDYLANCKWHIFRSGKILRVSEYFLL